MLAFIRRCSQSFIAKILLSLVLLSFVMWGIGDIPSLTGSKNIAKVNDVYITDTEYRRELSQLKESFGEHYSPELMKSLNLFETKMSQLIDQRLIDLEAERVGISVSDDTLASSIAKESIFQDANGSFDKTLFKQVLQQNNLSEHEYLRHQRRQIAADMLNLTFEINTNINAQYMRRIYDIRNAQRKTSLFLVSKPSDLSPFAGAMPSEEQVQTFYDTHKTEFMAPEYRTLQFLEIDPATITKGINISRKESFDTYQTRIKEFEVPQKRSIEQLLYGSKAEAESAYNLLRSGTNMQDVATKLPPKNKEALAIGARFKNQVNEGSEEIFSLEKGGYTAPIESAFGWHIFRVTDIENEHTADFETVQKSIEDELRQEKANDVLNKKLEQLEDALAASSNLETAAHNADLPLFKATSVDAKGVSIEQKNILTAKHYTEMLAKAFTLEAGKTSNVIATSDGHHFVVKAFSITPAQPRPLVEVRDQVISQMRQLAALEKIKQNADALAASLKKATPQQIGTLIQQYHAEAPISTIVGRSGMTADAETINTSTIKPKDPRLASDLPTDMLDALFVLDKGQYTSAYPYNNGYIIARLDETLQAPSPDNTEEGKQLFETLRRSMEQERKNEIKAAFIASLRKRYHVEVYQPVLQAIIDAELSTQQQEAQP